MEDTPRLNPNAFPVGPLPATAAGASLVLAFGAFEFFGEIVAAWYTDQGGIASNATDYATAAVTYGTGPTVAHSANSSATAFTAATPRLLTPAAGASRRPSAGNKLSISTTKTGGTGVASTVNSFYFIETMQSATDATTP